MLANLLRPVWNKFVSGLGKASIRIGISPDMWTFLSLGYAVLSAVYLQKGLFWEGLGLSILMLAADALDGATARANGVSSTFGTILDHVVDRYAEFMLFTGLLLSGQVPPGTVMFSVSGMLMASYIRAKAESMDGIKNCTVGIAGRVEKLLLTYLGIALLAFDMPRFANYSFWLVGLLSHITAIQRILYARSLLMKHRLSEKNIVAHMEN